MTRFVVAYSLLSSDLGSYKEAQVRNVMAQLSNMARRGALVGSVRYLYQSDKATRAGFKPLWLRQPERPRRTQMAKED